MKTAGRENPNHGATLPHNRAHGAVGQNRFRSIRGGCEARKIPAEGGVFFLDFSLYRTLSAEFPDERLKLLFVCAHPAIDPAMHTPLMLQAVLGLDAARIAGAFLVSPKTMGQRLVRAKTKIRDGGIQFEIPQDRELPQRLDAVLEAIYAAFGIGWGGMGGGGRARRGLARATHWA